MDVVFFRPLKGSWSKVVLKYRMENNGVSVSKLNFAPLLKQALDMLDTPRILKNGFKCTGLHPFNPDAIDYSKLIETSEKPSVVTENSEVEDSSLSILQVVEKKIHPDTLQLFKQAKPSGLWNGDSKHESFFYFWLDLTEEKGTSPNDNNEGDATTATSVV